MKLSSKSSSILAVSLLLAGSLSASSVAAPNPAEPTSDKANVSASVSPGLDNDEATEAPAAEAEAVTPEQGSTPEDTTEEQAAQYDPRYLDSEATLNDEGEAPDQATSPLRRSRYHVLKRGSAQSPREYSRLRPVLPEGFTQRPLLGVLQLNQQCQANRKKLSPDDEELAKDTRVILDNKKLLTSSMVTKLSADQQQQLLNDSYLMLYSRYAPQMFNCQKVLIIQPPSQGVYSATLVDLDDLQQHEFFAPPNLSESQALSFLIKQALLPSEEASRQVVASNTSHRYHALGADHISSEKTTQVFSSSEESEKAGFAPCPICFNHATAPANQNQVDKAPSFEVVESPLALPVLFDAEFYRTYRHLLRANELEDIDVRALLIKDKDYAAFPYYSDGPIYVTEGFYDLCESTGEIAATFAQELAHILLNHATDLRALCFSNNRRPWVINAQYNADRRRDRVLLIAGDTLTAITGNYWYLESDYFYPYSLYDLPPFGFSDDQVRQADKLAIALCYTAGYSPEDYCNYVTKVGTLAKQTNSNAWLQGRDNIEARLNDLKPIIDRLNSFSASLKFMRVYDPALARALTQNTVEYIDNPQVFAEFMKTYRRSLPYYAAEKWKELEQQDQANQPLGQDEAKTAVPEQERGESVASQEASQATNASND